ncbi:MAG: L,D-transpeptidase family protein [Planctomycetota bacterium]
MALPSQGSRVGMASGGRGGRRKKGGLGVIPVVFFLTLLGGGYGLYAYATGDGPGFFGGNDDRAGDDRADGGLAGTGEMNNEPAENGLGLGSGSRGTLALGDSGATRSREKDRAGPTPRPTLTIANREGGEGQGSGGPSSGGRGSSAVVDTKSELDRSSEDSRAKSQGSDERPRQSESSTRARQVSRLNASSPAVASMLRRAEQATRDGDLVGARRLLSDAILSGTLVGDDAARAREDAALINEDLVFTPRAVSGDRVSYEYFVGSGDTLSRIAKNEGLKTDWRLIQRVNQLVDPSRLRLGQKLKLVRGPFHAIVHKGSYRLDLFQGPRDATDDWLYIRSFEVGLGEFDGTPIGEFVVREDSKLINPRWPNPRTGEIFEADDPMNPIGEHWIGLRGLGEAAVATGYGIHGTIDPESIGGQESMGCIRMLPNDVGLIYELLMEDASLVIVRE